MWEIGAVEVDARAAVVGGIVVEVDRPGHIVRDEPVVHVVDEGRIVSETVTVGSSIDSPFAKDDPLVVRLGESDKPVETLGFGQEVFEHGHCFFG